MRETTPTVYLLAGGAGAGRTAYAQALEAQGAVRVGAGEHSELADHVAAGRDVVLDHGLDEPGVREEYKRLVEDNGGQWCLINLSVDHEGMLQRLATDPG